MVDVIPPVSPPKSVLFQRETHLLAVGKYANSVNM